MTLLLRLLTIHKPIVPDFLKPAADPLQGRPTAPNCAKLRLREFLAKDEEQLC
jgi:hypothetical protein